MKDATHITILLDRSGSMQSIKSSVVEGINSFVFQQKKVPGECTLTLVQFDDVERSEIVFDRKDLAEVPLLTEYSFEPRGCTPLHDAMALEITRLGKELSSMPEETRPSRVLFVIMTDGLENASTDHSGESVKKMVEKQNSQYNWQFIFLGANQDAVLTASSLGIPGSRAMTFAAGKAGVRGTYGAVGQTVSAYRVSDPGATASLNFSQANRSAAVSTVEEDEDFKIEDKK